MLQLYVFCSNKYSYQNNTFASSRMSMKLTYLFLGCLSLSCGNAYIGYMINLTMSIVFVWKRS